MFNFKTGTTLAIQQDLYLKIYAAGNTLTHKEVTDMEQNLWVSTAAKIAPGNLVIRQWALIDLFIGSPLHRDPILNLLNILTYKNQSDYSLLSEGYSYFEYSMNILQPWLDKFSSKIDLKDIQNIINKIKQGFIATSYLRNGVLYPAPYGDLRDQPLSPDLQIPHTMRTLAISNVIFNYIETDKAVWYSVGGRPIGLNTHISKDDYYTRIIDGIPMNFKFYQGYDKKYSSPWEEFKDTFDLKRLKSIIF